MHNQKVGIKSADNFIPLNLESFRLSNNPMLSTISQVKMTLRRHLEIVDWQGIEIVLAMSVAHYVPGEMLWFRLIGPSRSGKTELLRGIAKYTDCVTMEAITPAALRGGLKQGPKLLQRIDNKLVVTKDLASILTMRNDFRNEVFGLLRPIKDGELVSDFGSEEGHLSQSVRFDWIIGTTPNIEQHRQLESLLGERFIDLRWIPGNREEMAYQAGINNPYLESTIRPELAANICSLLGRAKEVASNIDLSDEEIRTISQYGDQTARLRTPVQRDRYRNLVAYPEPEIGTDLTQGLSRIVKGLKLLGLRWEPHLNRLLWDSMPKIRKEVLASLIQCEAGIDDITKLTKLSRRTVEYQLEDLRLLEVLNSSNQLCMQLHI